MWWKMCWIEKYLLPLPLQNLQRTLMMSLYNFAQPSFFFYDSCHPDKTKDFHHNHESFKTSILLYLIWVMKSMKLIWQKQKERCFYIKGSHVCIQSTKTNTTKNVLQYAFIFCWLWRSLVSKAIEFLSNSEAELKSKEYVLNLHH